MCLIRDTLYCQVAEGAYPIKYVVYHLNLNDRVMSEWVFPMSGAAAGIEREHPVMSAGTSEKNIVSGKVIPYNDAVIAIVYEEMRYKVILKKDTETETLLSVEYPIFGLARVGDTLNAITTYDMIEGTEYPDKNYTSVNLITRDVTVPDLTLPEGMCAYNFFWVDGKVFVWCITTDGYDIEKSELFELNDENEASEAIVADVNYAYTDGSFLYFTESDSPGDILAYNVQTHKTEECYAAKDADGSIYRWIVTKDYLYIEFDDKIARVNLYTGQEETLVTKDFDRFEAYRYYLTDSFNEKYFYYYDNASLNELEFENMSTKVILTGRFDGLTLIGDNLYYYTITDENATVEELRSIAVN
jgi:hypothetical protein